MTLKRGLIARHAPTRGPGGQEAAIIDVAQDLLLAHLHDQGLFDGLLVFKGGTALRKMYAGTAGRFSTDLDFALEPMDADRGSAVDLLAGAIDGYETDNFAYTVTEHRGKYSVGYASDLGDVSTLTTKLDIGPPVWLPPVHRPWVHASIHDAYELPDSLPVMALEENLAEKAARLNRSQLARDLYDLWWIGRTPPHSAFDEPLTAHLTALKCWVDVHGMRTTPVTWLVVDRAVTFDAATWLATNRKIDDESIGLLMNPPPDLAQLRNEVTARYGFMANVPADVLNAALQDRRGLNDIIKLLQALPGGRFDENVIIY
jgi:predicted nucleotidyltransferase component of viral defense system